MKTDAPSYKSAFYGPLQWTVKTTATYHYVFSKLHHLYHAVIKETREGRIFKLYWHGFLDTHTV